MREKHHIQSERFDNNTSIDSVYAWIVIKELFNLFCCKKLYWNITIVSFISAVDKFDYEGLQKALEQLADFEKKENARVVQSRVLKGLNIEDIKHAGQRLILHDGCRRFFQRIVKDEILKTDVHVLSYCWCGDFIRSAFSSGILFGTYILVF